MGADIPVLRCREGPQDSPLRHRPQAVPKGPSLVQEEGGVVGDQGVARAGTGAGTCQTRAKEQTRFLVTLLFSPFWHQPLGARGS